VGDSSAQIASWGTGSCASGCQKTFRKGLDSTGCMPLPLATDTHDNGVAGLAEMTLRVVGILRPSWCGFLASVAFMGCKKDNAHIKLASRQTGPRGEVAAHLAAVNLEGRKKLEGAVCTLFLLHFRSQEPLKHQKRFSLKKRCFGQVLRRRAEGVHSGPFLAFPSFM